MNCLEPMDLDGLRIEFEAVLVDQEFLNVLALIPLKLDHLAHLTVNNNGPIAREFLLDDLENFLLIELLRQALYSRQSLTTISLLNPNMDVVLRLLSLASVVVGFGEGVEGLEVLDSCHKSVCLMKRACLVVCKS